MTYKIISTNKQTFLQDLEDALSPQGGGYSLIDMNNFIAILGK